MLTFTTHQAAKKLGIDPGALRGYVSEGKVAPPDTIHVGGFHVHLWTEEDIERVRKRLTRICESQ